MQDDRLDPSQTFVVAAAIEQDPRLHAGTLVRDDFSIEDDRGNVWTPKNYDEKELGIDWRCGINILIRRLCIRFWTRPDQILDRLDDGIPVVN